jgi:hypothetical protein
MKILVVTLVIKHAGEQDELTSISTVTSYLSMSNRQNTAVYLTADHLVTFVLLMRAREYV